jgi:hypothetical protein
MSESAKNNLQKLLIFIGSGVIFSIITVIFLGGGFFYTTSATNVGFKRHIESDVEFQKLVLVKITTVESSIKSIQEIITDLKILVKDEVKSRGVDRKPLIWRENNYHNE